MRESEVSSRGVGAVVEKPSLKIDKVR
jgi:hypothetical protein